MYNYQTAMLVCDDYNPWTIIVYFLLHFSGPIISFYFDVLLFA